MTTTAGSSPQIDAYLAAVGASLADLAPDERADLLAEVEASLLESAGDSPIASLGPPEEFAAELRASAGLGAPLTPEASGDPLASLRSLAARVAGYPPVRALARLARELAPAWWLVRGYLVVVAIAALTGASWASSHPWLPILGSERAGALLVVVASALSLAVGLGTRRTGASVALALLVVNLAALVAVVPAVRHAQQDATPIIVQAAPSAADSFAYRALYDNGTQVLNIYPYSRAGTLLHDVQLYDQNGRPITLGLGDDPLRRIVRSKIGATLANAYPVRYREPGTGQVAHPNAAPYRRAPIVATPPLG
jgi:hypothetical protein